MTADERRIRFEAALEMVEKVYNDYCHDESKTREECGKFCDFVTDMVNFYSALKSEATKTPLDNQIDEAARRQTQQNNEEHSPSPQNGKPPLKVEENANPETRLHPQH